MHDQCFLYELKFCYRQLNSEPSKLANYKDNKWQWMGTLEHGPTSVYKMILVKYSYYHVSKDFFIRSPIYFIHVMGSYHGRNTSFAVNFYLYNCQQRIESRTEKGFWRHDRACIQPPNCSGSACPGVGQNVRGERRSGVGGQRWFGANSSVEREKASLS